MLSGGGARAAYEVGVLRAIYDGKGPAADRPPEVFCGTGAGAFNAAVLASRLPNQFPTPIAYLESLWADEIPREGRMRHSRVYRKRVDLGMFFDWPYIWRRPVKSWMQFFGDLGYVMPRQLKRIGQALAGGGLAAAVDLAIWNDTSPMRRLITESVNLGIIREGETGDGPLRVLRVIAAERGTGKPRIFRNEDFTEGAGYLAVLASCALPILFSPVKIQGKEFFYGGLVMQAPLGPAVEAGCSVIHLMHNEPRLDVDPDASAFESLNRAITVALAATLDRDIAARARMNQLLDAHAAAGTAPIAELAKERRVVVHQYRPKKVLGGKTGFLDFSRSQIEDAIAEGEKDAAAHDCEKEGCLL